MSVTGISNSLFTYDNQPITQKHPPRRMQQFIEDFQQLGEDLQSGNLSAAQADFATLQQIGPKGISDPTIQPSNPLSQAFAQLAQDLQSGDLSAAQKDYAEIQKVFQQHAERAEGHHHHGEAAAEIQRALHALEQALQDGDLASAKKAFAVLKHDLQKLAESRGQTAPPSPAVPAPPATGSVSVTA